ncbi:uncharacterized protein LOC111615738 [Centruroides sculpturatus]|uniref:uncharacterized protein LOC111615738 n=1 Tax=Centruroides sculpturatus TaxID=218467 RepID=UPI000C6E01EB|nr:uncharacterized protein LOC111615738 [Centruroides sculpturatus]
MQKTLVINSGSSSVKAKVFDQNLELLAQVLLEKIGEKNGRIKFYRPGQVWQKDLSLASHDQAFEALIELLKSEGVVADLASEIALVGHRVVMGGSFYRRATLATPEVLEKLTALSHLAPLHNPPNLLGVKLMQKLVLAPNVLVFDTAFHQSLDERRFLYPLPRYLYEQHLVRKYGMHGISYQYNLHRFRQESKIDRPNLIIFHLGNGSSVCAIKDGQSLDTSMGMTPLAGLMMGTRSGDIDPAVVIFLQRQLGLDYQAVDELLNRQSGLLALTGTTNDMREIEQAIAAGDPAAELAFEMYVDRLVSYYSAYLNELGNQIDGVIFTGGIGKNSRKVLRRFVEKVSISKLVLETKIDLADQSWVKVSTRASQFAIYVSETDEEIEIARQGLEVIGVRQPLIGRSEHE